MNIIRISLLNLGLFIVSALHAQDPQFSQFYNNPIYTNPAMAGSNHGCPRISLNTRVQNAFLAAESFTSAVSYDQYFRKLKGGISIQLTNDMVGNNTINSNGVSLGYALHLNLSDEFALLIGVQAGWRQKFLDWSKLTFGDMIDPSTGFVYHTGDVVTGRIFKENWTTKGFSDFNSGLVLYAERFHIGGAVKHLNRPNESMILSAGGNRLAMQFIGHTGANIAFDLKGKHDLLVSPNAMYMHQNGFNQLILGTYAKYAVFTLGAWYRTNDAFIASVGLDFNQIKLTYSHDKTISHLSNVSGGAHELALNLFF